MNCAEANKVDLVNYLCSLGHTATKIKGNDHWYVSPLRDERTASFKIDRSKNVWYDHGTGKGGTVIDFVMQCFNCDVQAVSQKLAKYISDNKIRSLVQTLGELNGTNGRNNADLFDSKHFSFQQQKWIDTNIINSGTDTPFHLHGNSLVDSEHAAETAIKIIAARQPITSPLLCRYLKERCINKNIADKYCHEVRFMLLEKDKVYVAIGFKNNAGGYELRNDFFKLSSAPKYVTYINNSDTKIDLKNEQHKIENLLSELTPDQSTISDRNSNLNASICNQISKQNHPKKQVKSITVFEGFFDFLSWLTIHHRQQAQLTNFLILNLLSFFERSLLLMEKHEEIHLYLDHDTAGRKCVEQALKRSAKYEDKSSLYKGYKDLNDWLMHFGKLDKKYSLKQSGGMGLS